MVKIEIWQVNFYGVKDEFIGTVSLSAVPPIGSYISIKPDSKIWKVIHVRFDIEKVSFKETDEDRATVLLIVKLSKSNYQD